MNKLKNKKIHTRYSILNTQYRGGFTLIEILIFTTIVSVFFVVAAAVTAASLNVMKTNENKIYATHYAEELIEWVRDQKETLDWTTFSTVRAVASPGIKWCINSATPAWPGTSGACSGATQYSLGSKFSREALLYRDAGGNVVTTITVSWLDYASKVQSVVIKTIFSQNE